MGRCKQCLLGVDIGSSGYKTVIVDLEEKILASASREYITYYPKPGYAKQDPNDWFSACSILKLC